MSAVAPNPCSRCGVRYELSVRKRSDEDGSGDVWSRDPRQGYCYHSPVSHYKTETLVRKWREGTKSPKQRRAIAYELSFRDPALALAEVRSAIAGRGGRADATLRLCLHHAADVATARELFADDPAFDPDALHLHAFGALLDDFLEALPRSDAEAAERLLRRLGFLAGPVPNPLVDAAEDGTADRTSAARYDALVARFLERTYTSDALAHLRPMLAEHLRRTYQPEAYRFLLDAWARGEATAIDAIPSVARLGYDAALAHLGAAKLARLVDGFVAEIRGPARRFERSALENGWLPSSAKELPAAQARAIATALLESERHAELHANAAEILVGLGEADPEHLLAHGAHLPEGLLTRAARQLPYGRAHELLSGLGIPSTHPALATHVDAPPDLTKVERALADHESAPARAFEDLASVARDAKHPHRDRAFALLLELARGDRKAFVKRTAVYQLGELGDARAIPVLEEALRDPALADSRHFAEDALASISRGGSGRSSSIP